MSAGSASSAPEHSGELLDLQTRSQWSQQGAGMPWKCSAQQVRAERLKLDFAKSSCLVPSQKCPPCAEPFLGIAVSNTRQCCRSRGLEQDLWSTHALH